MSIAVSTGRAEVFSEESREYSSKRNIIMSCFATMILCSYVAVKPDVPYPIPNHEKDSMGTKRRILRNIRIFILEKLSVTFLLLVFPEFVLKRAIMQRLRARSLHRNYRWIAVMGGFFYFDPSNGRPVGPVDHDSVSSIVLHTKPQMLDDQEIYESSKGDPLISTVAVLQGFWLIARCVTKAATSTPITKLELLACAYVMVNVVLVYAWWEKPRNIDRPIQVSIDQIDPALKSMVLEDSWSSPSYIKRVEMGLYNAYTFLWDGEDLLAFVYAHLVGGVFSAILCMGWSDNHLMAEELTLWRFCSLSGFAFFLTPIVIFPILLLVERMEAVELETGFRGYKKLLILITTLYIGVRVTTIGLAIKDLKLAPPIALEVVSWTNSIPHI